MQEQEELDKLLDEEMALTMLDY
eukprot:COSAG05_NODE_18465_length_308_cov_0.712919_1_plen_22_part_01